MMALGFGLGCHSVCNVVLLAQALGGLYCEYTMAIQAGIIKSSVDALDSSADAIDSFRKALKISMIIAACLVLPYVARSVHKSFKAFKKVSSPRPLGLGLGRQKRLQP